MLGVGTGAGATQGVLGDARASGDRERRGVADGARDDDFYYSRVPETLTASELEGFVAGVVGPESLKPTEGASMGEDVEEAQELAVDATRGADHARQDVD